MNAPIASLRGQIEFYKDPKSWGRAALIGFLAAQAVRVIGRYRADNS